jgi:hypothetical protein
MSKLKETAIVETPFAQAADLVENFLHKAVDANGKLTLQLTAAVAGVQLEHPVVVTFDRISGPNETIVFRLSWEAVGDGFFPVFRGTLTVAEDETYKTCRLILEGTYHPPLGVAGAVFDAVLGSRIAQATGAELLERLRTFLNASYQEVEREKRERVLLRGQS